MIGLMQETILDNAALNESEQALFASYRHKLAETREVLLSAKQSRELPILSLPEELETLPDLQALAKRIRTTSCGLIVLGTGGSSLGGKTLCELSEEDYETHFVENLDPHSMDKLLAHPKLSGMHLLIISKSGGTMETLTQAMILLQAMEKKIGREAIAKQVHVVTMPTESALRQLAESYAIPILEHDPKVGGRFSVLSNVGLLPAAIAGVDIAALQKGASACLQRLQEQEDGMSLIGAAWQAALMKTRPTSVMMPYCDRLKLLGDWFRQLWAESLGKGGMGSTPAAALGAVDQHSQLQLYLDGPKDKLFTFITLEHDGQGAVINQPIAGFEYLAGKSIGDAMGALQQGTIETLKRHQLPVRLLSAKALNAELLGEILMHLMLETMATAHLLGINAYDQPAVEESKILAREALGAS